MLQEVLFRISQHLNLQLRDAQSEVCLEYMKHQDVIFIAPTGYGKSVAFQLAPFLLSANRTGDRTTLQMPTSRVIIVMPTIALIKDSMIKLESRFSNSEITVPAVHLTRATVEAAADATYIFTSPEGILDADCGRRLFTSTELASEIAAIFFDECHLLEDWGESNRGQTAAFREKFSRMGELRSLFPQAVFVAMTATATEATSKYVKETLLLKHPSVIRVNPDKLNISYHYIPMSTKSLLNFDWLVRLVATHERDTPKTLVFFRDTGLLSTAYAYLCHHTGQMIGHESPIIAMYSSLTSDERKSHVLRSLNQPEASGRDAEVRVVLCTSSLAVGVNLADIKYVVHYGLPGSTNDFLQETGRAGREEGSVASSIVIGYPRMMAGRRPSAAIKEFVSTRSCRREALLRGYNATKDASHGQSCCDNCGAPRPAFLPPSHRNTPADWSDSSSSPSHGSVGDVIPDDVDIHDDTDSEFGDDEEVADM